MLCGMKIFPKISDCLFFHAPINIILSNFFDSYTHLSKRTAICLKKTTPHKFERYKINLFFYFSLIFGNIYIFFAWRGKEYVSSAMRTTLFTGLAILDWDIKEIFKIYYD